MNRGDRLKVSAIVAALNEGPRIADVVKTLRSCCEIDEILVVDDGSTDDTAETAMKAGARVLSLPFNIGKGGAVAKGLEMTRGEIVLLVDADLIGLTKKHLKDLIGPVRSKEADMTIGVFRGGRFSTFFSNAVAQRFTGQRAFRRDLFEPGQLTGTRYGLEAMLSQVSKQKGVKVLKVILDDITQVTKEEKMGFSKGSKQRLTMYAEVVRQYFRWFFPAR